MIVKGLNSQKKLTQQQKHIAIYKYVKKNNKKMRPFYNKSQTKEQKKSSTEAQLLKNLKLNKFNTLLTKFTNQVKKAIKQQRKLGINPKTPGQSSKSKLSKKKHSLSIKKIIQYETLKKNQQNFSSIRNSMLISKKSIGLNLDKSANQTFQLVQTKKAKGKSLRKFPAPKKHTKNVVSTQPTCQNDPSLEIDHKNSQKQDKKYFFQKKASPTVQKQFIPLGKLSQTLPSNYKKYLLQNLSRYKDKDNQEDYDDRLKTSSIQILQRGRQKKGNKQREIKKQNDNDKTLQHNNVLFMERQCLKSKQLKTQIINRSKSKYRKPKQRQQFHPKKELLNGHIFNLSNTFVQKHLIKSKKQTFGVGPWGHPNQSISIDRSPH